MNDYLYTYQDAIKLASNIRELRDRKFNPVPPTREEAIALIAHQLKVCGFNWITGQTAIRVLEESALTS